mmetsp:Transcript_23739/g.35402  ORF Transcript_23739/g.35402 Transcript_23739/m.35402 type:complete len:124 (-) Transcript_23739:1280-1651(-)
MRESNEDCDDDDLKSNDTGTIGHRNTNICGVCHTCDPVLDNVDESSIDNSGVVTCHDREKRKGDKENVDCWLKCAAFGDVDHQTIHNCGVCHNGEKRKGGLEHVDCWLKGATYFCMYSLPDRF